MPFLYVIPTVTELSVVVGIYLACAALHAVLPATIASGYVLDERTNKPLRYRLNGLRVLVVFSALALILDYLGLVHLRYLSDNLWGCVCAANVVGLAASAAFYLHGSSLPLNQRGGLGARCRTVDQAAQPPLDTTKYQMAKLGFAVNFYCGIVFNPRIGSWWDWKMFLYIAGAVMLQTMLLAAVVTQYAVYGVVGSSLAVYCALFTAFVVDYMYHEHVHLYTYDLFAERVGFKLTWGCLCFYPFFYSLGVWSHVGAIELATDSWLECYAFDLAGALFFVLGWALSRGANMQKYHFKLDPKAHFLGIAPVTADHTDDGRPGRLLCSGWWGLSRHVNYLGEILMAVGIALCGNTLLLKKWLPWTYPVYYVALLLPREIEDSKLCELKYGPTVWRTYVRRVPYRIIPYIY